jgi:hypothetical protein
MIYFESGSVSSLGIGIFPVFRPYVGKWLSADNSKKGQIKKKLQLFE